MFFPRLRRRAKWVFALLAVAFALAFVVAGVGTGFGSGFGDYLADLFNVQQQTGGASAEEARKRLERNPRDAAAQLELAKALETEGNVEEAIAAYERYTELEPRDAEALESLAALYAVNASEAATRARAAQDELARVSFGSELVAPTSPLAQVFGSDPVLASARERASARYQAASLAAQTAYREEARVWRELTLLLPEEASNFRELGRASLAAGDLTDAIAAYERYLELAPDAPDAAQIRELLKQLRAANQGVGGG